MQVHKEVADHLWNSTKHERNSTKKVVETTCMKCAMGCYKVVMATYKCQVARMRKKCTRKVEITGFEPAGKVEPGTGKKNH